MIEGGHGKVRGAEQYWNQAFARLKYRGCTQFKLNLNAQVVPGSESHWVWKTEDYIDHHRAQMGRRPRFGRKGFTLLDNGHVSAANQRRMRSALAEDEGYVR